MVAKCGGITLHSYIDPTRQKDAITKKIIYVDFETYVCGFNAETNEKHDYQTYAGADLQYFLDNECYYQPFPYVPFELDIAKYKYQ